MTDPDQHDDEELELDRLLNKARSIQNEARDLLNVREAIAAVQKNRLEDDLAIARLAFDKWRAIHKYIHARPFRLPGGMARSDEWRQVAQKYTPLGEAELMDWIALQIDVARAREGGGYDQRIRRDGPCYLIALEYTANKKRTALAVLHWASEQAQNRFPQKDG